MWYEDFLSGKWDVCGPDSVLFLPNLLPCISPFYLLFQFRRQETALWCIQLLMRPKCIQLSAGCLKSSQSPTGSCQSWRPLRSYGFAAKAVLRVYSVSVTSKHWISGTPWVINGCVWLSSELRKASWSQPNKLPHQALTDSMCCSFSCSLFKIKVMN